MQSANNYCSPNTTFFLSLCKFSLQYIFKISCFYASFSYSVLHWIWGFLITNTADFCWDFFEISRKQYFPASDTVKMPLRGIRKNKKFASEKIYNKYIRQTLPIFWFYFGIPWFCEFEISYFLHLKSLFFIYI